MIAERCAHAVVPHAQAAELSYKLGQYAAVATNAGIGRLTREPCRLKEKRWTSQFQGTCSLAAGTSSVVSAGGDALATTNLGGGSPAKPAFTSIFCLWFSVPKFTRLCRETLFQFSSAIPEFSDLALQSPATASSLRIREYERKLVRRKQSC